MGSCIGTIDENKKKEIKEKIINNYGHYSSAKACWDDNKFLIKDILDKLNNPIKFNREQGVQELVKFLERNYVKPYEEEIIRHLSEYLEVKYYE